ncbi:MAG: glycosyltransferase [Promethearchaeota archaeon]
MALASKILRKELILDLQDIPGHISLDWHKLFNGSLIVPLSISASKLAITVNDPIKKEISYFKSSSSIRVIPNGIDSEIIRNMTKNSRLQTAVFVGGSSLDWYYEPEFLIKTACFLKEINSDINLKIVGVSTPLQIELSKLIKKHNLTDYVTISSPKPLEELYDTLLRSSVGIIQFSKKSRTFYDYASSLLALPAKVIEYLACGLSVAYRGPNGPLVRLLTRNSVGAIVDTESPKVFASCINDAFQLRQENPSHFDNFSKKFLRRYDQITLFDRFLQSIFY